MKRTARLLCAISLLLFLAPAPSTLAQSAATKHKPGLRAGAATSNITPSIGGAIIGGFHPFPSTHIHDELHARCLVLDSGETRIALVVLDLLGIGREVSDEARKLVEKQTGIPATNVLISATHTHSAVSALGTNRFLINQPLDDYQRFVAQRIADGVQRAVNQLEPARIGWAVDEEPRQVFNRRWFMKPGTVPVNPFGEFDQVKMNPQRASKDLDRPAGPTDPQVTVLAVQSLDGRPIGAYASYSLHYVGGVGNGHISADYYGMFCARFSELLNPPKADAPFVAMLGNGTSGNINNIDFSKPAVSQPPYTKMREVAEDVAQAAL
ncbi:MAG TPA: neutral/alkaline non-lysosomal ceramidase N-terminal domain-containing protein, partial [Roseimicrobium sp.]|nr:neutral/alkaline non-lysosomal ceramidase N-terminal domain-containing protein [Roseimicrobium sp.]